jgi:hypothetical protein
MLHQAHSDAVHSTLLAIEAEIGRARLGHGGKNGFEPGSIGYVTFDHYSARPTVEVVGEDEHGRPTTELHTLTGTKGRVPGDMQIHTHAAVMNVVETPSGRVGGLDLAQLEGRIHEWGALYHAYLAKMSASMAWRLHSITAPKCHGLRRCRRVLWHNWRSRKKPNFSW